MFGCTVEEWEAVPDFANTFIADPDRGALRLELPEPGRGTRVSRDLPLPRTTEGRLYVRRRDGHDPAHLRRAHLRVPLTGSSPDSAPERTEGTVAVSPGGRIAARTGGGEVARGCNHPGRSVLE